MNFNDLIAKSVIQIKESNEFFGALMLFSEFKKSEQIPTAGSISKPACRRLSDLNHCLGEGQEGEFLSILCSKFGLKFKNDIILSSISFLSLL